ncbi:tyrosine-type recombinase/integrase [Chakrabartyella piscis]|uniref:tyrosine-type recombinase/integrase n=1 Tax=Chakrabartyella piscis TaxID=2918914 RepID=UPI002958AF37|nr:tyrosine-type recombinase/integrase [Chakrabartyella piscis]
MRSPNGWGTVAKLSGNRRNPFVVRKTRGWNEKGHPIYETIGYYPTREEGMIALAEYNKNPYDVDASKITLAELYQQWSERAFAKMSKSSMGSLKSAYNHTKPLWKMKYKEVKSFHMQDVIDNCGRGYSTQWAIKNLFGHLDKFALEVDVINKGYVALITAAPIPETSKKPFTDEEVSMLWERQGDPWVDSVLFLLYSGYRISEMLGMKTENINLEDQTMKGGVKTVAGKDRVIPIHSKVLDIAVRHYNQGNEYLFTYNGKKLSTSQYYVFWNSIMDGCGMHHTPHECRHTFRSRLDSAGANKVCIDRIMGHSSGGTGERIYTHKTLAELKQAIELITK